MITSLRIQRKLKEKCPRKMSSNRIGNELMYRINRLQEEVDKLKIDLKQQKLTVDDKGDEVKKGYEKIIQENKKLERQRNELLQAFKKQLKLIDILKRQKTHLEAAKMLNFTEEEFIKALDLAEKIN
jgi:hypothetical protein